MIGGDPVAEGESPSQLARDQMLPMDYTQMITEPNFIIFE